MLLTELAGLEACALTPPRTRKQAIAEANRRRASIGLPLLSASTVSDWFNRGSPARDFATLWTMIEVLVEWADPRTRMDQRDQAIVRQVHQRRWKLLWEAARDEPPPPGPASGARHVRAELATAAAEPQRLEEPEDTEAERTTRHVVQDRARIRGSLVQAGTIEDDVHVHPPQASPRAPSVRARPGVVIRIERGGEAIEFFDAELARLWVTAALGPPPAPAPPGPVHRDDVPVTERAPSTGRALDLTGTVLSGHTGNVTAVAFAPKGRLLATASSDGTARLWEVPAGSPAGAPLAGHRDGVRAVAFSPDGRLLATASMDRTVRLWDPVTGEQIGQPLTGHTSAVWDLAFAPDRTLLASASMDRTVRLWDPATGEQIGQPLTGHTSGVDTVTFSPNARLLASGGGDTVVRLWDPLSGQLASAPLTGHRSAVRAVAFSPNGRLLATGGWDDTVRLWDPVTFRPVGPPLVGHRNAVRAVAFSSDGRLLASASMDRTVRLWDPATGLSVGSPLTGSVKGLKAAAFAPHEPLLASTDGSTVLLWRAPTERT